MVGTRWHIVLYSSKDYHCLRKSWPIACVKRNCQIVVHAKRSRAVVIIIIMIIIISAFSTILDNIDHDMCKHSKSILTVMTNQIGQWWRCGHVVVYTDQVHRGRVGTVEETCDWALTVTFRSLWTTSSQHECRLFLLRWRPPASKGGRVVQRTWRPDCPTGRRSSGGWYLCVTLGRCSL